MPRPKQSRHISAEPQVTYFKPQGVPMIYLKEVRLSVEGLEALRLADLEGLTAVQAAQHMHISRHTFGRVLQEARRAVAQALVQGRALCIEGGVYDYLPKKQPGLPARATDRKAEYEENTMTRLAISSEGPTLADPVDPRFGRAGGFVLVDLPDMSVSYLDNGLAQTRAQGAGIETAEKMSEAGVNVVLSGYVGPKAFEALQAADIKVCQDLDGFTVGEAVQRFKDGLAPFADAPNKL